MEGRADNGVRMERGMARRVERRIPGTEENGERRGGGWLEKKKCQLCRGNPSSYQNGKRLEILGRSFVCDLCFMMYIIAS